MGQGALPTPDVQWRLSLNSSTSSKVKLNNKVFVRRGKKQKQGGRAMSICIHVTNRILFFEPSCPKRVPVPDQPIGLAGILGMIGIKYQETRPPRRSPCDKKLRSYSRIMKISASAVLQACHGGGKGKATRPFNPARFGCPGNRH